MPFTFGGVFGRFFKLIGENFALFVVLGLLLNIAPVIGANYALLHLVGATQETWTAKAYTFTTQSWAIGIGFTLAVGVLNLFSMAAITEIAILRSVGKKAELGSILAHALGNIVPIFVISLIVGLLTGLCFLLLAIPGIMYAIASCVAVPAYVGQPGVGLMGAVQKSYELTKGHRWSIFALFLVGGIALTAVEGAISAPITLAPMMQAMTSGSAANVDPNNPAYLLVSAVLNGISSLLTQIFVVAIYVCLRQSREKATPDVAAAVFE
ncbi:MAG: hypothetical protein QM647_15655 [Asticcacaulis sp.]|uniref:hypothetical protein n=1 Tax=Asticcacaulis sp. TaxID=1872648 RepID=UPI0039E2E318